MCDIFFDSETDDMSDDEESHSLPSDEEVSAKDKNEADIEFKSALKKLKK